MRVSTAQAGRSGVTSVHVELENVPGEKERSRPRRGRPPGAKGSRIALIKRRLALLVVMAKSTHQMATTFGVTERTIRTWLADPEVRREVSTAEEELRQRTERQLMRAFRKSIIAMEKLLDGKGHGKGSTRSVLRMIELLWTALGRLPPKGRALRCATPTTSR